jgi:endonuclease YncB( thermonuclease family)
MIQVGPDGSYKSDAESAGQPAVQAPTQGVVADIPQAPEAPRYLLVLKDRTIYTIVAYWVDGDTLHYFTDGKTHNQISLSLIDGPQTERLNREMGIDFSLPAEAKPSAK